MENDTFKYYFAYGSNMNAEQMAQRCPEHLLVGQAILEDYEFIITTRGYASIIPVQGKTVQGLVYQINPTDEATLDRNEGVAIGC